MLHMGEVVVLWILNVLSNRLQTLRSIPVQLLVEGTDGRRLPVIKTLRVRIWLCLNRLDD